MNAKTKPWFGIFALLFLICGIVSYSIFYLEKSFGYPLLNVSNLIEQIPENASLTTEIKAQLDQEGSKFRLNPLLYIRVYDYRVVKGAAPVIYMYGEKMPSSGLDAWKTMDKCFGIDTGSYFSQSDFLHFFSLSGHISVYLAILFGCMQAVKSSDRKYYARILQESKQP